MLDPKVNYGRLRLADALRELRAAERRATMGRLAAERARAARWRFDAALRDLPRPRYYP